MLDISEAALSALHIAHDRREIERLAALVLSKSGRAAPDEATRTAAIDRALANAQEYGLEDVRSLGLFAGYCLTLGEAFHRHPACQAILADPHIARCDKMDRLMHPRFQAVWSEIAAARA